jgi:vacuolar-type H+-ATPase subunit H
MVQRTEIVRQAKRTARRAIDEAQDEARRLRHEAEDYCDHKLAGFEIVLERTIKTVQSGRERLRVTPLATSEVAAIAGVDPDSGEHDAFFDQDTT